MGAVIRSVDEVRVSKNHGSVFEFLRNASLDARNYFDSKDHRQTADSRRL